MKGKVSRKRHIVKTITWRIIPSGTNFFWLCSFFMTMKRRLKKGTGIAIAESAIKMVFYYFHERDWYNSNFGIKIPHHDKIDTDEPK